MSDAGRNAHVTNLRVIDVGGHSVLESVPREVGSFRGSIQIGDIASGNTPLQAACVDTAEVNDVTDKHNT